MSKKHVRKPDAIKPRDVRTPIQIQAILDELAYSDDDFYRCPRRTLADAKGHCVDGALLACACLRRLGHVPRVVWISAENDDGHLLAVYQERGLWGSVAKSNFVGLRGREPVYRSLRELAMSYFNDYFNTKRFRSMRSYSAPIDLRRFDHLDWESSDEHLDEIIDNRLDRIRTYPVAPASVIRRLPLADERLFKANMLFANPKGLFKPR